MLLGEKIKLRAYRKEDVEKACEYMNDIETRRFLAETIPYPILLEQEEKWYEGLLNSRDNYDFAIEDIETGKYIGGCGINKLDWKNKVATVGIFIGDKNYWGRGYGTDSMKLLINFIFEEMNINKIKLAVYSFNDRARKCYEKCGFVLEGTLRQELFRNGRYNDVYTMSILFEEWMERKNK